MSSTVMREERMEDTLFALMMEDFVREQGNALLEENERLKQEPETPELKALRNKGLKIIEQYYRAKRPSARKLFRAILAALLAALLLCGSAAAFWEPVRSAVARWIVETNKTFMGFYTEGPDGAVSTGPHILRPEWLPEDYELSEQSEYTDQFQSLVYQNENESYLIITRFESGGTNFILDTENAKVSTLDINGADATLIEKADRIKLAWKCPAGGEYIVIHADSLSREDVVRIAEHLAA